MLSLGVATDVHEAPGLLPYREVVKWSMDYFKLIATIYKIISFAYYLYRFQVVLKVKSITLEHLRGVLMPSKALKTGLESEKGMD